MTMWEKTIGLFMALVLLCSSIGAVFADEVVADQQSMTQTISEDQLRLQQMDRLQTHLRLLLKLCDTSGLGTMQQYSHTMRQMIAATETEQTRLMQTIQVQTKQQALTQSQAQIKSQTQSQTQQQDQLHTQQQTQQHSGTSANQATSRGKGH